MPRAWTVGTRPGRRIPWPCRQRRSPEMEHLLSILRRPGGLTGLVVTWEPGVAPAAGAALDTVVQPSVRERPLGELRSARRWSALAGAWRRLERSAPAREDVLADALMVLLETRRADEEPRM